MKNILITFVLYTTVWKYFIFLILFLFLFLFKNNNNSDVKFKNFKYLHVKKINKSEVFKIFNYYKY